MCQRQEARPQARGRASRRCPGLPPRAAAESRSFCARSARARGRLWPTHMHTHGSAGSRVPGAASAPGAGGSPRAGRVPARLALKFPGTLTARGPLRGGPVVSNESPVARLPPSPHRACTGRGGRWGCSRPARHSVLVQEEGCYHQGRARFPHPAPSPNSKKKIQNTATHCAPAPRVHPRARGTHGSVCGCASLQGAGAVREAGAGAAGGWRGGPEDARSRRALEHQPAPGCTAAASGAARCERGRAWAGAGLGAGEPRGPRGQPSGLRERPGGGPARALAEPRRPSSWPPLLAPPQCTVVGVGTARTRRRARPAGHRPSEPRAPPRHPQPPAEEGAGTPAPAPPCAPAELGLAGRAPPPPPAARGRGKARRELAGECAGRELRARGARRGAGLRSRPHARSRSSRRRGRRGPQSLTARSEPRSPAWA
ncbi:hypothetical protein P7K49_028366 [Saguinus oedipus]|uniref:Uncharacterized protein n=1 Tax=Saguinus oedipus TaxID=9490 RepID=A0ABQ9UDE1_SAGOE|nr:hypothetical protein P7K49_028366 [Saguinus oedipus]